MQRRALAILALLVVGIWLAVFQLPDSNLHIIACDVGQGDAILVAYKNIQILIDGGPNNKVLECLSKYLPFWDREIELAILTHPEKDHYFGLIEGFRRYRIDNFLYNPAISGTELVEVLEKEVGREGASTITPYAGKTISIGLISLEIVHPPSDFKDSKINNYSIVTILKFGEFEALLTGDIEDSVSNLLATSPLIRPVEYIKVPHHGSKNGLSEDLLKILEPKLGIISVGKNNVYKHPHQEVLDLLQKYGVKVLRTGEMRDIEVITDGEKYWLR